MKKIIDFKVNEERIQDFADEQYEGNFTLAARKLVAVGLREIDRIEGDLYIKSVLKNLSPAATKLLDEDIKKSEASE